MTLRSPAARAAACLVLLYVVSRALLLAVGFRFEVGLATSAVQNVDPELLRRHLAQSLWYLHGQPPLWNALYGVSLKLLPGHWASAWHVVFLGLGLVEVLALFALLLELRLSVAAAAVIAGVFVITPPVLAYENSFFYDYPTMVLVTVTALLFARFVSLPTFGRGLALFCSAGALVLLRTLFQIWWVLAVIALALVACRGRRRVVLATCALPLALVVAVVAKNWLLFGVPGTTSWTGMGVARSAVVALPLAERRQLVRAGKLHTVSLVKPLASLSAYEAVGIRPARPTGVPLLDRPAGSVSPRNLENKTYIHISRLYWDDDRWIVEHRFGAYVRSVGHGLADFFASPTLGGADVSRMRFYDRWYSILTLGRFGLGKAGLFLIGAYLVAVGYGAAVAVRRLRPGAGPAVAATAFAALTVAYVAVVGNLAEVGENFRFAFVVEPLVLGLLVSFGRA